MDLSASIKLSDLPVVGSALPADLMIELQSLRVMVASASLSRQSVETVLTSLRTADVAVGNRRHEQSRYSVPVRLFGFLYRRHLVGRIRRYRPPLGGAVAVIRRHGAPWKRKWRITLPKSAQSAAA